MNRLNRIKINLNISKSNSLHLRQSEKTKAAMYESRN